MTHPVQFTFAAPVAHYYACSLCGALVTDQDLHRESHDAHNAVHRQIEQEAHEYREPPRYG